MQLHHYTFNTIDVYRENLGFFGIDSYQLAAGEFEVSSSTVVFENVTLTTRWVSRSVLHYVNSVGNRFIVVVPLCEQDALVDGQIVNSAGVFFRTPYTSGVSKYPCEYKAIFVEFTLDKLADYFSATELNKILATIHSVNFSDLADGSLALFRKLLVKVQSIAEQAAKCPIPENARALEHFIFSALQVLLQPVVTRTAQARTVTRNNVVSRALSYLTFSKHSEVSVVDLANHACCSVRTLEYAFKQVIACSPKHYIKIRQLHFIRRALSESRSNSVKEVLAEFDISNQARFSREYRQFFAETPSDTLKSKRQALLA